MANGKISRRRFINTASALSASVAAVSFTNLDVGAEDNRNAESQRRSHSLNNHPEGNITTEYELDLSPAKWIWYPAKRILPNSFFHFRKEWNAGEKIKSAKGWIVGDSRYVLFCNGKRIQFGPAPSDPRFTEADPIDLTSILIQGTNTIGATVLYYGFGDGTWPGKLDAMMFDYNNKKRKK